MATQADHSIADIIAAGGGPSAIARSLSALGTAITPQAVGQWKRVPGERALDIEALTGISRYRIRPDIYGPEPKLEAAE